MNPNEILQEYFSGKRNANWAIEKFQDYYGPGNTRGRAWLTNKVQQRDPSITKPPKLWIDGGAKESTQDQGREVAEEESGIPVDRQWSERPSQQPTPQDVLDANARQRAQDAQAQAQRELQEQRELEEQREAADAAADDAAEDRQRQRQREAAAAASAERQAQRDADAAAAAAAAADDDTDDGMDDGMDDGIGGGGFVPPTYGEADGEVIDTPEMTEFETELDEALTVTPIVTPSLTENIFDPEYFRDPANIDLAKGLYMQHLGISDVGQSRYQKWLMDQWLTPYTEFMLRGQELLGGLEGGVDMDFRDYLAQREGPMSRLQGDFMGAILDMDPEEQVGLFDFLGGETGAVAQRVYQGGLRDQVPGWVAQARAARAFDPNVITSFNISDAALDAENLTSFLSYLRGRYNPDSQPSTTNPMMLPDSPDGLGPYNLSDDFNLEAWSRQQDLGQNPYIPDWARDYINQQSPINEDLSLNENYIWDPIEE